MAPEPPASTGISLCLFFWWQNGIPVCRVGSVNKELRDFFSGCGREKEKKKSAPRGAPQGASGCFGASSESVLRIIVTFVLGTPAISNSRHTVNLKYVRHIYACTELRTRLRCLLARCLLARCFRERPIRFLLLIPRVIPLGRGLSSMLRPPYAPAPPLTPVPRAHGFAFARFLGGDSSSPSSSSSPPLSSPGDIPNSSP